MDRTITTSRLKRIAAAMCLAGLAGWVQAGPVSDQMLAKDAGDSWLHANGNWAGHRYSTLTQINNGNAKDLKVAWIFSAGGKNDAQNTPLFHDGMVFFAQDNKVFALNADDGRVVWKYEHKLPEDWGGYNVPFITGKHRGLAIYGENVYFLSNDAKLHAINYKSGKAAFVKDFQEDGFPYPKDFAKAQDATGYAITVGPLAIPGAIIVPMNGTDFGGLPGYVLGCDPGNGRVMWKANMIPGPGEPGHDTWPEGSTKYGGAGPWITGSWDPDLKMYFTGTANAYEWNPKNRGGGEMDNVGAASIVAVNTTDGSVAWRYVGVPGDPWDFDIPQTPMLIAIDGKKTIVQPNKTGYIHHLDAKTGKFLKADKFIDKVTWISGYDANGRPQNMIALPKEGGDPIEIYPSLLGGVNMYPNAYNPKTGNLYLAASESGMKYGFEEIKVISNVRHFGAYQEFIWGDETDKAVNAKTGKEVWRDTRKGKPGYAGGMMTTAGNITVYTTQAGDFQVVDASNGKILYHMNLGTTAKSGPITFMNKGKQMIVQAVGGLPGFGRDEAIGLEFGSAVVAFTR
ncbi:MAG TPA: PQQ-binding-like beta-propeller repeat protein [Burkholderiales bacterium]|nr:PQQ-binding-like beta-propeller repeat protein [Burkholderiales bacterium]